MWPEAALGPAQQEWWWALVMQEIPSKHMSHFNEDDWEKKRGENWAGLCAQQRQSRLTWQEVEACERPWTRTKARPNNLLKQNKCRCVVTTGSQNPVYQRWAQGLKSLTLNSTDMGGVQSLSKLKSAPECRPLSHWRMDEERPEC